jgi:hypothetical protein
MILHNKELITCKLHQILLGCQKEDEMGGHAALHKKFWSESLEGWDHAEDLYVDVKIILEWILGK